MSVSNGIGWIAPFIIPLALTFVLSWPLVLHTIMTSFGKKNRIPIYVFVTSLSILLCIGGMTLSGDHPTSIWTGFILASLLTVSAMAVLLPSSIFRHTISGKKKRIAIVIGSAFQIPLLFALLVNPESRANGLLPLFADRLPALGIIFDAVANALGTADQAGYESLFSIGVILGFYIEVAVVSTVASLVIASLWRE